MHESTPAVTMGRNEFQALVQVITAYLAVLRSRPSSAATRRQIQVLVHLSARIKAAFLHGNTVEGLSMPMTVEEVSALQAAMSGFITQLCRLVPRSQARAEIIAGIQELQDRLAAQQHPQRLN